MAEPKFETLEIGAPSHQEKLQVADRGVGHYSNKKVTKRMVRYLAL